MLQRASIRFILFLLLVLAFPAAPRAQGLSVGAGAGVSVPVGSMAERRSAGERLVGSLGYRFPDSRLGVRADLAWTRLYGEPQPEDFGYSWSHGDLHSTGLTASLVYRFAEGGMEPYALVGVGSYGMQIQGAARNPYGRVLGVSSGMGVEFPLAGQRLFVEGRGKVILSDYGAAEWSPGVYLPITAGIRVDGLNPPRAPAAVGAAALPEWRPDDSRLFGIPSGRGLRGGDVHAAATGLWTAFTVPRSPGVYTPRPSLALGLADWLAVHGGYYFEREPRDPRFPVHHHGIAFAGAEVSAGADRRGIAIGGQLNFPQGNEFGRRISESVAYGMGYFGGEERALTVGLGWRGYPIVSRPGWEGSGFALVGGHWEVHPNVRLVSETTLMGVAFLQTTNGVRFGIDDLSLDASATCGLNYGGSRCRYPVLNASYRTNLLRR
jgi:hypothetical protein